MAQGEAQVAPEEADKGHHLQTVRRHSCRGANASSSIPTAVPISIGKWVARTTRPPACAMRRDGSLQAVLIVVIECRKGLVEEPQRRRRHRQSGECQPPPLAGRQPSAGPIRHRLEREGGQRRIEHRRPAADAAATQRSPEDERFARRQPRLDAVLMADIVQAGTMTGEIVVNRCHPPGETPCRRRAIKPASRRSRLVLPPPLAPLSTSAPPAGRRNDETGKDEALTAPACEIRGDQIGPRLRRRYRPPGGHFYVLSGLRRN